MNWRAVANSLIDESQKYRASMNSGKDIVTVQGHYLVASLLLSLAAAIGEGLRDEGDQDSRANSVDDASERDG